MTIHEGVTFAIIVYLVIDGVADIYRQITINLRLNSLERSRGDQDV